jgi:hypothetical protein
MSITTTETNNTNNNRINPDRAAKAGAALHSGLITMQQQQQQQQQQQVLGSRVGVSMIGGGGGGNGHGYHRHSGAFFQRAVVCIEPINPFSRCLTEYDIAGVSSTIAPVETSFSLSLPGACILRLQPDIFSLINDMTPSRVLASLSAVNPRIRVHCAVVIEDANGNFKSIDASSTAISSSSTSSSSSSTSALLSSSSSSSSSSPSTSSLSIDRTNTSLDSTSTLGAGAGGGGGSEPGNSLRSVLRAVGASRAWQRAIGRIVSRDRSPSSTETFQSATLTNSGGRGRGGGGGRGRGGAH